MGFIKFILLLGIVALFIPNFDSSSPSGFGAELKSKLDVGKGDFESLDFRGSIMAMNAPEDAKEFVANVADYFQDVSRKIDTAWVQEGMERSEIAFACMLARTNDHQEMNRLKDNLAASMQLTDPEAIADLGVQLNEYRKELIYAAFYRERCQR